MISINNTKCEIANLDEILSIGCIDHASEETDTVFCDKQNLSDIQKTVYDNFFALCSGKSFVSIENHSCILGVDRMTHLDIETDTLVLNYIEMSDNDKISVDNFINLLLELSQKD